MPDAGDILARVRALGANIILDGDGFRVVNGGKLPEDAVKFIRQHKRDIAAYLSEEKKGEFEERAAIIEYDGKAPRQWAEQFARLLVADRPPGISEVDWSWFLTACGRIIDEAPPRTEAA